MRSFNRSQIFSLWQVKHTDFSFSFRVPFSFGSEILTVLMAGKHRSHNNLTTTDIKAGLTGLLCITWAAWVGISVHMLEMSLIFITYYLLLQYLVKTKYNKSTIKEGLICMGFFLSYCHDWQLWRLESQSMKTGIIKLAETNKPGCKTHQVKWMVTIPKTFKCFTLSII
jgi:hypothetical protein